jgi:hypothetical protein
MRVLVVGCGGNGSAIAAGLPYLHQALLAYGHRKAFTSLCSIQTSSRRQIACGSRSVNPKLVSINLWFLPTG